MPPPIRLRRTRASSTWSCVPTNSEPTGAPSPLDRQTASASVSAPYASSGVPVATCAFQIRAPSMCSAQPTPSAQARSACRSASGSTAPPAKLWVFSTETAVVRTKNGPMSGAYISSMAARSTCPRGCDQVRLVSPVNAPCAPSSARRMWARDSHSTSWPGPTSDASASTLAIDPVGVNSAASLPNRPATRSCSACTVGSSSYTSSPTSASAMARRIAGVGRVRVSD